MHVVVRNPSRQTIRYLDVNSLYPFVMSTTKFPVGHPSIRGGDHSSQNLLRELKNKGQSFIGICLVRVLAPKQLMVPFLLHKIDGKLMFFLCRSCSLNGNIQCNPCHHTNLEHSWIDTYTSIDVQGAEKIGYQVLEYYELWHYSKGGDEFFKDFILNIVRRKIECSGYPMACVSLEDKQNYIDQLFERNGIKTSINDIRFNPAGRYLNKIMANLVWGKWTQNPSGQQEIKTCSTLREFHDCLYSGRVKRVSLISEKLLQVEMKLDRQIDGENRERENNRSGLGGEEPNNWCVCYCHL